MADLKTVFTDDDGDGFYDDIHVVNVMSQNNNSVQSEPKVKVIYEKSNSVSSSSTYIPRTNKLLKKFLISLLVLAGFGVISFGIFALKFFF